MSHLSDAYDTFYFSCVYFSSLLIPIKMSLTNLTMKVLGPGSLPVCASFHILNYPLIVLVDCHIIKSPYPLVVSVEYFQGSKFPAQKFSSFKFIILNMITVSFSFAHSFKIMRISQPGWTGVILLHASQALRCGRGYEIDIAYICCIDVRVNEAFEPWAIA